MCGAMNRGEAPSRKKSNTPKRLHQDPTKTQHKKRKGYVQTEIGRGEEDAMPWSELHPRPEIDQLSPPHPGGLMATSWRRWQLKIINQLTTFSCSVWVHQIITPLYLTYVFIMSTTRIGPTNTHKPWIFSIIQGFFLCVV